MPNLCRSRAVPVVLAALMLAACAPASTRPPGPATPAAPAAPVVVAPAVPASPSGLSPRAIRRVLELFDLADQAMTQKRLTSPEADNAWRHYREILAIQPGNGEARRGLVNIVERYIQWSDTAAQQGRLDQARAYLARAARVKDDHPPLRAAQARLDRLGAPSERFVPLDAVALQRRDKALKGQLGALADRIRESDARVVIEAPSDRQGRWIYQQLNARHEEYRIRANIRLERRPGIRLLYAPAEGAPAEGAR